MKMISRRARPHIITLYNYLATSAGVAEYQRTVIKHVHLDTAYQQRLSQRGFATTDKAQLIIDLRDIEATDDRTFLPFSEWQQLPAGQKPQHFTFSISNDFFVHGIASEALPPATKQQLIAKYQCFSVTSCSAPASSFTAPTIVEVTGK